MKLAWIFCLLLAGKLSTASPEGEDRAPAEANLGSEYMMAFPMNEDNLAEESTQAAVKLLAETLASDSDDDKKDDDAAESADKKEEDQTEQPEPMRILQAELDAEEEAERPALPQRPFFKRPKIDELRKILGFPPPEGPVKAKPIPQEKPKVFQSIFNKPKPQQPKIEQSPLGGLQFNLRREDRLRPFGFPMLPLKRENSFSPFGMSDLVQAASSILRRAIVDDNSENDISKDDKEEDDQMSENEPEDNDEEDDDDSVMIVPLPEQKDNVVNIQRPPLFRRFPLPLPFPVPRPAAPQPRARLPLPPLTPVAFFLPIAHQIMQNLRQAEARSQPPMIPLAPMHQPQIQFLPIQQQVPIIPLHHPMPQQQQLIPIHHPIFPMHQPVQQFIPIFPMPQASVHVPLLTPFHPNMQQRPLMRPMPRRLPMHPPPQQMQRRMPFPAPMNRMAAPQQMQPPHLINPMLRRPMQQAAHSRPMPRVVRPPMPPLQPVLFMMPMPFPNAHHVPIAQAQQHMPVFHRPQPLPFLPQQMMMSSAPQARHMMPGNDEDRIIFVRQDQEDQDDDQEVLILIPTDDVEVAQRPPLMPPQMMRQLPSPVMNPLQRIKLLRDLLLTRQAGRGQDMSPEAQASRVVEIVQQQLRIFPAHHQSQVQAHQRPEPSELHPVYVPYPGPQ